MTSLSTRVGDNKVDILILGAGWVSHFLIPLLGSSHLTYAATSRSGLPGTLGWNLGDSAEGLPSASTVVVMFPINEWSALKELVDGYTKIHGEGRWILLGSTRGWQTVDSDPSGTVVTRHTPLPPDAPSRSFVEQNFLEAFPDRGVVLNLVGLHGSPPVSGGVPHGAPRLVPNFLKRVAGTKDALRQKASVHFVHGSDVALAIVLVHQKGRDAVGRWIVSDGLVRDWWAIALELGTEREKGWVLELMREEGVKVLPRQKGLGRIMDGSEFWMELGALSPVHHMGDLRVTFLGTSSGGGPTEGRNCSSLALSIRDELWLVDCAEGSQRQIHKCRHLDVHKVTKIFITHMHIDHCAGVVPLLSTVMSVFSTRAQACGNDPNKLHIEIYGTPGLRHLVRTTLSLTHMNLSGKYVVHELHTTPLGVNENVEPVVPAFPLHPNEIAGVDILSDSQEFWRNVGADLVVCVGYVFTEKSTSGSSILPRRLVCLGDTSSAAHIVPLCLADGVCPSLVVHESTNAWIPPHVDHKRHFGGARKTPQSVREKALSRGHSTPDIAGAFARSVQAEQLVLIHFSAMFKYHSSPKDPIMREIARQATAAWGRKGAHAVTAHDLLYVDISPRNRDASGSQVPANATEPPTRTMVWDPELWEEPLEPDQEMPPNLKRKWDARQRGGGPSRGTWKHGRGRGRGRGGNATGGGS